MDSNDEDGAAAFLMKTFKICSDYSNNLNIIRTIFTNNRGPIAYVRIIHVN